ncbi:MAG: hypothetical protein NTX18_00425 [Cyanobium sp. LacPavin_0818_WC50_MAG_67_9]|nr:hypothetical protein [Cyanobium sp. LacPavin_0818_WC50_MAG_67_9]
MAALRLHKLVASGGVGVLIGIFGLGPGGQAPPAAAQEKGYGQTISSPQQERELDYGTGTNRGGSALDSTNPWELMNKLRKATSLDDATQPGDAVDAALKDFDSQSSPPAKASPAAAVKGP